MLPKSYSLLFHQYIISNYLFRKVKWGPWKKDRAWKASGCTVAHGVAGTIELNENLVPEISIQLPLDYKNIKELFLQDKTREKLTLFIPIHKKEGWASIFSLILNCRQKLQDRPKRVSMPNFVVKNKNIITNWKFSMLTKSKFPFRASTLVIANSFQIILLCILVSITAFT